MPVYRDEAIVLRTQRLGEADRIVTLLTREHGQLRAVAKGVRKTSSRLGARVEPFSHVDLMLAHGKSLEIISQAETLAAYGAELAKDYPKWTAGQAMLETAEKLTAEGQEPALQQFLLLLAGLRSLVNSEHDPGLILDAFILRSLAVAGYAPSFADCAQCGESGPHRAFSPSAGGMVCSSCRPIGSASPRPETVELMSALLTGEWDVADQASAINRHESRSLTAAYLTWQLDRQLRSLRLVERTQ
ncbi:MAG: repair protein RecO [Actinomycetota bacterium]|jgi:DNA repair protein RecO (recombination protein O)